MRKVVKNYDTEQIIKQKIEEDLNNAGEIYRFFFGITYPIARDFHEAEDVVQNSLTDLWEEAGYYKSPINIEVPLLKDRRIRAYMGSIARNNARDIVRKRKGFRKVHILYSDYLCKENDYARNGKVHCLEELTVAYETPVSLIIQSEEKKLIAKLISELPEFLRNVINMFYYGGKKDKEIAEELNVPIGTVKSRLNRAKYLLGEKLKKSLLFN